MPISPTVKNAAFELITDSRSSNVSVMLGVEPSSRQTSSTLSMSFSMHSRRVTSSRMFLLAPAHELFLSYGLKSKSNIAKMYMFDGFLTFSGIMIQYVDLKKYINNEISSSRCTVMC